MRMSRKIHMALDIEGCLNYYKRRKMNNIFQKEDGSYMTGKEARIELKKLLAKGYTAIPIGTCDNFDYVKGCCLGHDIKYFDDNDKEITKEEYEAALCTNKD